MNLFTSNATCRKSIKNLNMNKFTILVKCRPVKQETVRKMILPHTKHVSIIFFNTSASWLTCQGEIVFRCPKINAQDLPTFLHYKNLAKFLKCWTPGESFKASIFKRHGPTKMLLNYFAVTR